MPLGNLHPIFTVIARARRRLRLMAALDAGTTAAILAVTGTLVVLWLRRMEWLPDAHGALIIGGLGGAVVIVAVIAAFRRLPAKQVATRIDRASGLADRLGTACDFSERLAAPADDLHPDTRALMERAIADGVAAAPRADVRRAAPFRAPRDARALVAFTTVAAIVALLRFGPEPDRALAAAAAAAPARPSQPAEPQESLDPDDIDYQRQFVEEMKQLATQTQDPSLQQMSEELTALLDKAEKGEISKQELIARMETLEQKYMAGKGGDDLDKTVADLKEQGKQLKKNPITQKLGEAMEAGDLETAKQELEKLAEKIDKNDLKPEQQKQLAEALEKTADQQEKKRQREEEKQEQQAQREIQKQKEEVRRLEKKAEQKPEDEQVKRTLQKEKRELEKLERENQQRKDQPERQLDRLSRNMKQAAESLRQKNQQQSSQNLRKAADETRKMQDDMRRMGNQKKVQSQLGDLKEAIRRAKPRKGQGQRGQQQARMQRIQEWEKRAGGQRGNAQAWRGQGQQPGESQGKEGQLGKGNQQSQQYGDQHDPNLSGDETSRFGKTKDERLTGLHGQGPSRRETILTSAKKGFAQQGYKQVYTDYRKAAEEVMNKEKVPQGYKYYVKRYFQRIKPHSMD